MAVDFRLLRERRDELDLSNAELAEQVELSVGYVGNILYGTDQPHRRVLHRLARVLGLTVVDGDVRRPPEGDPSEPPEQPPNEPTAPPPRKPGRAGRGPRRDESAVVSS
jgi:transcriptional regulator with XRE-family HTH domain